MRWAVDTSCDRAQESGYKVVDLMNHIDAILKNVVWSDRYDEASFIGTLHERAVWDTEKYRELEAAVYGLAAQPKDFPPLIWPLFRIFSYTTLSLAAHFDPNDAFRIDNLTDAQIYDYRERFQLVFEGVFSGNMPVQSASFSTPNPLLEAGK